MQKSFGNIFSVSKLSYGLIIFWAAVFLLNTGPHWEKYSSTREMIETVGMVTSLQMLVALVTIKWLTPAFLDTDRRPLFFIGLFLLLVVASEINILIRFYYLEPQYPDSYTGFLKAYGHMTLVERMSLFWTLRYIIFNKLPLFLFPTALLVANGFYQKQQALLKLEEQKRTAELDALKNQLNPHFIFNTLNNIYALALKKSDQTATAVEKLSSILDYVVYRCNDKFVPLSSELALIEDYVALEKIRYRKRLSVAIQADLSESIKIAPLLLLTLLENACKHGTREELNEAKISISLTTPGDDIKFTITNTKPNSLSPPNPDQGNIGLANLEKQLALLYPDAHSFETVDATDHFIATLRVEQR